MINRASVNKPQLVVVGLAVISLVVLITYAPALQMGFRMVDDYSHLYRTGSLSLPQFLSDALDPRAQANNYRPAWRMIFLAEYTLFGSEPSYYHLIQILIHGVNALLIFWIVQRLTRKFQLAFLAAVLFAGFPIASEAVFWISDQSTWATCFSLLSVGFWLDYLLGKKRSRYSLALGAFVLALLCKESAVILPVVLFLGDRMVIREHLTISGLIRRYWMVATVMVAYLAIEYGIQSQGLYVVAGGYSFGAHVFSNYWAYLEMLFDPWTQNPSFGDSVLVIAGFVGLMVLLFVKRSWELIFLIVITLVAIGPVVLAPLGIGARYLYMAVIPWTLVWSGFIQFIATHWQSSRLKFILALILASFISMASIGSAEVGASFAETARQNRVPFRDIIRQHPQFPVDSRLFFVEPPFNTPITEIAGMFFLRYNSTVSVGGTFPDWRPATYGLLRGEKADFQKHQAGFIYYFNENHPTEMMVEKVAGVQTSPQLPVDFGAPIRLEDFEVTSSILRKDNPIALILYWRATGTPEKDYTVFVHLVDFNGDTIVGDDSFPRNGKEKTSTWRSDQFTADAHILMIPPDAAIGKGYSLEVGMYYLPTMERLPMTDAQGNALTDHIIIGPFEVVE